ncbi:hypothetical protein GCM10027344_02630 [Spelaeicoccus albus]|uniref:Uncharacterized protein n=1 Tax=Spelaeicoccus albus TaxID=1280376 RepID=A0A7Z0D1W9_9MICO|nr:hypothetical protein [Spelaeicoccus albus]
MSEGFRSGSKARTADLVGVAQARILSSLSGSRPYGSETDGQLGHNAQNSGEDSAKIGHWCLGGGQGFSAQAFVWYVGILRRLPLTVSLLETGRVGIVRGPACGFPW